MKNLFKQAKVYPLLPRACQKIKPYCGWLGWRPASSAIQKHSQQPLQGCFRVFLNRFLASHPARTSLATSLIFWQALSFLCSVNAAYAENANQQQPKSEEVDISDIQNQYWKAHDKEFEVIQNKQYTKAGRIEVSPLFGIYQRVDFQDTKTIGGSIAYHFSEIWGIEAMGYKMLTDDSSILKRFKETRNATIEFNEEKQYFGLNVLFTPIYAKFSFLGKKISHFDMYISPGAGAIKTVEYRPAFSIAIGQKFWVTPKWNVRLEYRWMRYNDRVQTNEGATAVRNGGPGYFEDSVTNQNLMFGISYLFN